MYKCIIWGIGNDYERIINQLQFEILKGNITVEALVARTQDIVESTLDGFRIINKEDVRNIKFDYLIITSSLYYKEIYKETMELGINEEKIINGRVMNIPLFDFERYIRLIKNKITILSDDCWGGHIYHYLCMQFYSPLININWRDEEFAKFIQDPYYYLCKPLKMEREGNVRGNIYPIASLGEDDKKIEMDLIHSVCFADAERLWNRRRKRINRDNFFVKMSFNATDEKKEKYLEAFSNVPYKKICFYSGETEYDAVVYLKRFEKYVYSHPNITLEYAIYPLQDQWLLKSIDILKLLNGEPDFIREI